MEKVDGNLNKWLTKHHDVKEWESLIFQMLCGLYVMQEHSKTFHDDLKPKNILFIKILNKQKYFHYKIKNNSYYLPFQNYIFIIADFGRAKSVLLNHGAKEYNEYIKKNICDNKDFYELKNLYGRIAVSYFIKTFNQDEIFNIARKNKGFYKYIKIERNKIYKELHKYPKNIKEGMVTKSAAYFIVENELYDINKISEKNKYLKLPPDEIKILMDEIFSKRGDIDIIIDKYFNKYSHKVPTENILDEFDTSIKPKNILKNMIN
jgi:serine/threonine protein kinase